MSKSERSARVKLQLLRIAVMKALERCWEGETPFRELEAALEVDMKGVVVSESRAIKTSTGHRFRTACK